MGSWEYFNDMDGVYGTRSDVCVPMITLESALENLEYVLSGSSSPSSNSNPSSSPNEPPKNQVQCEILDYLRDEGNVDKEMMKKFLKCDQKKIKVEEIEEIKKLREMLSYIYI